MDPSTDPWTKSVKSEIKQTFFLGHPNPQSRILNLFCLFDLKLQYGSCNCSAQSFERLPAENTHKVGNFHNNRKITLMSWFNWNFWLQKYHKETATREVQYGWCHQPASCTLPQSSLQQGKLTATSGKIRRKSVAVLKAQAKTRRTQALPFFFFFLVYYSIGYYSYYSIV